MEPSIQPEVKPIKFLNSINKPLKNKFVKWIAAIAAFIYLFFYLVGESDNTYNPHVPGDYHSALFADAAGYHVYLPGVFNSWFFGKVPEKADSIAGNGFIISNDKKIRTKYPYGTALLQAPVYLIGKIHGSIVNEPYEGNSVLNHKYSDFAGIFYGLSGVFLIFFYVIKRTDFFTALLASAILLFGTNVYYYIVKASGVSHTYSFFLFALLLHAVSYFEKRTVSSFVLLSICCLLIYLVRPLNVLYIPLALFIESTSFKNVKEKFLQVLTVKNILVFLVLAIILIIPQLIYWKWAFGSYLPDTYPGETFSNLLKPNVIPFLFAPHNGLIPYSPAIIIFLVCLFIYPFLCKWEGTAILVFILVMTYLSTAWYTYSMGCGFGARNFVEYAAILVVPFSITVNKLLKKWFLKLSLFAILIYPIMINLTLTTNFDMCFFGKHDWDWKEYKYLFYQKLIKIKADPENTSNFISVPKIVTYDNQQCFSTDRAEFACTLSFPFEKLNKVPTVMCSISADINNFGSEADFDFVVQIIRNGQQIYYSGNPIKNQLNGWYKAGNIAYFPKDILLTDELRIFILNKNRASLLVNNIEITTR